MDLLIGTNNPGKVEEVRSVLDGLSVALFTLKDLALSLNPDETGMTYADNALLKARAFHRLSGMPTLTEDAGIEVSALPGELGVHTRRWGKGPDATDHEWISYFLERMEGIADRRAIFYSAVAFIDPHGTEHLFHGQCHGEIANSLQESFPVGLPFEGCFRPDGYPCVYGALTRQQKNTISHRGRALLGLRSHLVKYLSSRHDVRP